MSEHERGESRAREVGRDVPLAPGLEVTGRAGGVVAYEDAVWFGAVSLACVALMWAPAF